MMYPNYYYPGTYTAPTVPNNYTSAPVPPTQQNTSFIWVQGEAAARAYMVSAGQSVLLMDSESDVFYIKSADNSGMPLPLRVFDYKERVEEPQAQTIQQTDQFITREEFEARIAQLTTSASAPTTKKRNARTEVEG